MSKESTLTVRVGRDLRSEIERCAKENEASISEVVEEALRGFCERRQRERLRRRNLPRALRALARISGCISHGRPSQDIDDELYGPMR